MSIETLVDSVIALAGRTAEDPELQAFLQGWDAWPLPKFPSDEYNVDVCRYADGFDLMFSDASLNKHAALGKPRYTHVFDGCYFYMQGKDGHDEFRGPLPMGVQWSDAAESLVARLGQPANNIVNKKTGKLMAQRWALDGGVKVTVGYRDGVIEDVYVGI